MGTHDCDEALVRRIQAGEIRAFEILHRRYYAKIYKLALIKTSNVEDAKDIASETFYRALAHMGSYKFQGCPSLYPWLHRIASNLVVDWCRQHNPSRSLSLDAETQEGVRRFLETLRDDSPSPQELVERKEVQILVRSAISRLPIDQADVISYRFLGELSIKEISSCMNRSESAVKSLIHRGLVTLRQNLREILNQAESSVKTTQRGKTTDVARGSIEIHRRTS